MKKGKLLLIVLVAAILGVAYSFLGQNALVIADTNGSADSSLAVLTEADILSRGKGTVVSGPKTKESTGNLFGLDFSSGIKYYSDDFSGVYVIAEWNYLAKSDAVFTLYDFQVTGGNFRMCFVSETEILATIQPGDQCEFRMDDLPRGSYALVVAGESAAFEFTSFDFEE